ncbi:MAG: hypothetical protein ABIA59_06820 [Candidatus Latescibacterota bacterium]
MSFFKAKLWDALTTGRGLAILQTSVFVAGFLCLALVSLRLGPLVDYDVKNYHYYAGYAFLNGRIDVDYAPAQIQSFLNPLSFVPFYLLATNTAPMTTGFVLGGIHGLAVGLVFLIVFALFPSMAALPRIALSLACALLGVYAPAFISLLGGSFNGSLLNLFVLLSVYLMIRVITRDGESDSRSGIKYILLAGLLMGLAVGLKLTNSIFLVGISVATLAAGSIWRSRLKAAAWLAAAAVAGIIISRGFWMAKLWSKFDSPIFPFYNKIFHSPYYYDKNIVDTRLLPKTIGDAFLWPFSFLTSPPWNPDRYFRDSRYAVVYVLLILCLVYLAARYLRGRRRAAAATAQTRCTANPAAGARTFLVVFFAVSYVLWQTQFSIMHYALTLEMFAPAVAAILIVTMLRGRYLRLGAIVLALGIIAVVMRPIQSHRGTWSSSYVHVEAPMFDRPGDTLVIFADNQPWSYVIPFFQPEVRFVGLLSNFSHTMQATGGVRHEATRAMLDMVKAHDGPIFVLSNATRIRATLSSLEEMDIVLKSDRCIMVQSEHEKYPLCLWPVEVKAR